MTAEVERLKAGEGQKALNVLSELLEQEGCQPDFVNAKTRGQRPPDNTALHLACKAKNAEGLGDGGVAAGRQGSAGTKQSAGNGLQTGMVFMFSNCRL